MVRERGSYMPTEPLVWEQLWPALQYLLDTAYGYRGVKYLIGFAIFAAAPNVILLVLLAHPTRPVSELGMAYLRFALVVVALAMFEQGRKEFYGPRSLAS